MDPAKFGAAFLGVTFLVAGFDLLFAFIMRTQREATSEVYQVSDR